MTPPYLFVKAKMTRSPETCVPSRVPGGAADGAAAAADVSAYNHPFLSPLRSDGLDRCGGNVGNGTGDVVC